jgi:DUF971 family protein
MLKYRLKKIDRPKPHLLRTEWQDAYKSVIKIEKFRDECPCADCREKRDNKDTKFSMPTFSPGRNELKELKPVGNYAITPIWGDGHNTGIYPWELVREIFEKHELQGDDLIKEMESNRKEIPTLNVRNN